MSDDFLQSTVDILIRTPHTLRALLSGIPEERARLSYAPAAFSPFDVLGHLIHGERTDWLVRAETILRHGPDKPFEPFDRFAMRQESAGKTTEQLLGDFATLRAGSVHRLRTLHLSEADLARTGTHPELGTVTLKQLLATWAVHDLGHIAQICRGLAAGWKAEVGPWEAYLGILRPAP